MIRRLALLALALVVAGCVTTSDNEPEPWERDERSDLHTRMGVTYFQRGQIEVAREELELALRTNPGNSGAHLAMAQLEIRLENPERARHHYSRAVRLDDNNITARNEFGYFLCERGDIEAGLALLTDALNNPLNRTQYLSLYGAAECQRLTGDIARATEYYETAIGLQPDMRPALWRLATISFEQGEHLRTRAFLERYFADGFASDESLFLAVRNELQLGQRELASDYARQLRTRFPESGRVGQLRQLFQDAG